MKRQLGIIILIFIQVNLCAGYGGVRTNNYLDVDEFEQKYNYYYKSINDTIFYTNEKGKDKFVKATVNIAFYNIEKDTILLLFKTDFDHKIKAFMYENSYNDTLKKVEFVIVDDIYGCNYVKNNLNIEQREVSDQVYIVTYSVTDGKYYLWTCHKTGINLELVSAFQDFHDFKIDVFNDVILIVNRLGNKEIGIEKIEKQ